jgi:hypothetical protein
MAWANLTVWVPDTTEGPVVDEVHLRLCETCHAPIPEQFMDDHVATQHQQTVTPH